VLAPSWRANVNVRFSTIAEAPLDWRAGREPENGDGLNLTRVARARFASVAARRFRNASASS